MTLRSAQKGAASLVVAMILLFGMTMVAFYANRGLLFEQKTSANQYRATSAFEVAEAGIEWAIARLNDPQKIDAFCRGEGFAVATDKTFRDKYFGHTTTPTFDPLLMATVRPGCLLPANGDARVCSCPGAGNPSLGTASEPRFAIWFQSAGPEAVAITSRGCTAGTQCIEASTTSDATAIVRVIVKLLPTLRSDPKAALTAGGDVTLGGRTDNIINDVANNFMTVNAASLRVTWPGAPVIALTTPDPPENAVFRAHFGQDMADYKANAATTIVCDASVVFGGICPAGSLPPCIGGVACATQVVTEIAKGRTQFWIDAELTFTDANTPVGGVGSANSPVLLVSPYTLTFSGTRPLYGVLFGASQSWDILGLGTTEVRGAIIARNDFNTTGNFTLRYDPEVLRKLRPAAGAMVRVPGSWSPTL